MQQPPNDQEISDAQREMARRVNKFRATMIEASHRFAAGAFREHQAEMRISALIGAAAQIALETGCTEYALKFIANTFGGELEIVDQAAAHLAGVKPEGQA